MWCATSSLSLFHIHKTKVSEQILIAGSSWMGWCYCIAWVFTRNSPVLDRLFWSGMYFFLPSDPFEDMFLPSTLAQMCLGCLGSQFFLSVIINPESLNSSEYWMFRKVCQWSPLIATFTQLSAISFQVNEFLRTEWQDGFSMDCSNGIGKVNGYCKKVFWLDFFFNSFHSKTFQ